jgi:hypothetical protein
MAITEMAIYFFATRYFGRFWFIADKMNASVLIFLLGIMIVFLSCVTYTGAWLIFARRNHAIFWKAFTLFDILPGILGFLSNLVYP